MPTSTPPAVADHPAADKSRRRGVTSIVAFHQATALVSLCAASGNVALSFATLEGIVRVVVPAHSFLPVARGECDSNGRPYDQPTGRASTITGEQVAEMGPKEPAATRRDYVRERQLRGRKVSLGQQAKYRDAWQRRITTGESVTVLASEIGVSLQTLSGWFAKFRTEPGAPVLKPGGRL